MTTRSFYRKMVGITFFILSVIFYYYKGQTDEAVLMALYAIFVLLLDLAW